MTDITSARDLTDRRTLIVEDEYMIADEMQRALQAAGSTVIGPVPTVEEAIDLIEQGQVELAVLDVNLGGQPVWPVADALEARGVHYVFTTGYDASALPPRYASVPRCEKPVDMHRVARALLR
jgi:two-component SAPR family response regulator